MKKIAAIGVNLALMLSLSGCADMSNQSGGVLAGGAIGGALGSLFGSGSGKILAAVGGAVLGGYLGGHIGHSMDVQDRRNLNQSLETTRTDKVNHWRNPNNGNSYTVEPTRTYYRGDQPCRDFTTTADIGGKRKVIYGKACRKADGTWKVIQ